ncbi:MAG: hypothetical protein GF330_07475, partial [Candidatus Eisenbacteria bacterium]|nr:hypothetical protein [Candidatus Eisenbacteria bacterium]
MDPTSGPERQRSRGAPRPPLLSDAPVRAGGLTIRLATAFGFCQGVRGAVDRALRAARAHPASSPAGGTAA